MKPEILCKLLAAALVVALSGCAAVDTKTIVSNSDAYLATHFTPAQLAPPVRTMVEKGSQLPKQFSRIDFKLTADLDEEGKTSQVTANNTFINLGNGYVQSKVEYAKNGVPYRINLALTFAGMYRLRTQTSFLDRANALFPFDVKEMIRFDRALGQPHAGASYTVSAKTGTEPQIMNYADEAQVCTAGQPAAASTVYASLTGSAVPLECVITGANGAMVGKAKFMWIADLGVGFQTDYTSARSTSRYRIESLDIQK